MSTKTLAIKVFYGDQLVDTQTLSQDVIKIGKLKSSHVCLDDEAVARMRFWPSPVTRGYRIVVTGERHG